MRRLALTISLLVVGAFVAACDDDDDTVTRVDAAVDARTSTNVGVDTCNAEPMYTRASFGAAVRSGGACAGPADVDALCDVDVEGLTRGCGTSCLLQNPMATQEQLLVCIRGCLDGALMSKPKRPTAACVTCYDTAAACTIAKCLSACTNASSQACIDCQETYGCNAQFFVCSGLPGGEGERADAGAADARD